MDTLRVEVGFGFFHRGVKRSGWEERLLGNYPAACGKSRHRASSVAVVRDGIGGILDVRWDILIKASGLCRRSGALRMLSKRGDDDDEDGRSS